MRERMRVQRKQAEPAGIQLGLNVSPGRALSSWASPSLSTPAAGLPIQRCGCNKKDDEERVSRREDQTHDGRHPNELVADLEGAQALVQSGGNPLETNTQQFMESRFGHHFGHVRVHTDARAHDSAVSLNALAYTLGSSLVFGQGQYQPESETGRELLAHELAHVVQQDRGLPSGTPAVDTGVNDPLEHEAENIAHEALSGTAQGEPALSAATHSVQIPTAVNKGVSSPGLVSSAVAVQRAPTEWEPERALADPNNLPAGHTAGNDYQGPHGAVTEVEHPTQLGGSTWWGGLTSYGCYCGPGGDATGSRCGPGAPAIDAQDEQCRQHDTNYGKVGVSSVPKPGENGMFTKQGWLDSEDADRRLATGNRDAIRANPDAFSPSAKFYGQGIQGLFGARAGTAHAYKWGSKRYDEASVGLENAYDGATNWLGDRASDVGDGVTDTASRAVNWAGDRASDASSGVNNFINEAENWDSVGDAASGLLGGAGRAGNWLQSAAGDVATGVTGTASRAVNWGVNTTTDAVTSAADATARAGRWVGNTGADAVSGVADAAVDVARWGMETSEVVGEMIGNGIVNVASSVSDGVSGVASGVADGVSNAASSVADGAGDAWRWLTD